MSVYVLIPLFNEEGNIPELIQSLVNLPIDEKKFFVFSDDGSTDNSVSLIENQLMGHDFIVLGDGINRGPGGSFNIGFEWILSHSTSDDDMIMTMEADNTCDLSLAPKMITISKLGYELVLASIYAQGGGFDKTSFMRKSLSFVANMVLRFAFDINVLTLSSFYRVYQISLLKKIKKNYGTIINEYGFICKIELLIKSINQKANIIELPMILKSHKRKGKSKMKIFKTIMTYLKFFLSRRSKL